MAQSTRCPRCKETKDRSQFSPQAVYCKPCAAAYKRDQRLADPDRARAQDRRYYANRSDDQKKRDQAARHRWRAKNLEDQNAKNRATHIRRRYGLEVDEYEAMLAAGCAICGSHERVGMDHCHDTGHCRAALCSACNAALGFLRDDPARARAAADYLEFHREAAA